MSVLRRNTKPEEKVLDVNASMQGTMVFKDPVNLHINGEFEGRLDTKGTLYIGQTAAVKADIHGEEITIAGKVNGNITATKKLSIIAPAEVNGDIITPSLSIAEGAVLNGRCLMSEDRGQMADGRGQKSEVRGQRAEGRMLSLNEVANYLEIDTATVEEWARQNKLPAFRENDNWKFHKEDVDNWIAKEKVGR